jgi:hypothetical protein
MKPSNPIVMNSRNDFLFVAAIPGAFITFDPTSTADGASEAASQPKAAKKGACGRCLFCKCKRSKG